MNVTKKLWKTVPGMCAQEPELDCYIPEDKTTDIAIVILPGGGYAGLAAHEGQGYAEFLNDHGISAFVCRYRVAPHRFPLPLLDARRAVRYIRYYCDEFGISKDKVYIMGSSAGGHLAALVSTYYNQLEFEINDEIDAESARPNGQILCYPVIKLLGKRVGHLGSGKNLLGPYHAELGEELSPDTIVTNQTPKAFIWHTFDDQGVNVINSLDYARALRENNVDVEMHIYPHGSHGLGLARQNEHVSDWSKQLISWLDYNEKIERPPV
jgi:acetyl esterase/lipase